MQSPPPIDWQIQPLAEKPLVTIAVPSYNQGKFLNDALNSIFSQQIEIEVFIADGGSRDETRDIIQKWAPQLAGWRSGPDQGQAAAINEAIAKGSAPYVCWINSDDALMPNALTKMIAALEANLKAPMVYGQAWHADAALKPTKQVWTEDFSPERMALRCIVAQPATLMRRSAWEAVGGVNADLQLAMDYDLWWRLYQKFGPLLYLKEDLALNRVHAETKTNTQRAQHYCEAIEVVRQHYGLAPSKWWFAWPYAVWWRGRNS